MAFLLLGDVTPSWSSLTSSSASSPGLRAPLLADSSAARAFLGLGRVAGMVMGTVTRGVGAKAAAGAGSSPKGSGAGQLAKVDGAGLGCGGAGRALGVLARLSTGSGGLFLEPGVLMGSRASGVPGTSSVEPPSSRTAALSARQEGEPCESGLGGLSGLRDERLSHPAVPTCWRQGGAAPGTLHWIREGHAFLDLSSASERPTSALSLLPVSISAQAGGGGLCADTQRVRQAPSPGGLAPKTYRSWLWCWVSARDPAPWRRAPQTLARPHPCSPRRLCWSSGCGA